MIFISKYLVPVGFTGIAIYPLVILKDKVLLNNKVLINHERIHLKQQLELLIIPFYFIYGIEFLIRLVQLKNWTLAYKNISFEREAYLNEKDLNYLESRPYLNIIKYL